MIVDLCCTLIMESSTFYMTRNCHFKFAKKFLAVRFLKKLLFPMKSRCIKLSEKVSKLILNFQPYVNALLKGRPNQNLFKQA